MPNQFIAQFTEGGGPNPQLELDRIVSQAEPTDIESQQDTAWFPTNRGVQGWKESDDSQCLVFCRTRSGEIDAIHARVVEVSRKLPDDPIVLDYYSDHEFPVWWKVTDIRRMSFASLKDIPGVSMTGKPANETFSGNATFAFWSFPNQEINASSNGKESSLSQSNDLLDSNTTTLTHVPQKSQRSLSSVSHDVSSGMPLLHGVDFSGGVERADRGNGKIWIATWDVERNTVNLESGDQGNFRRRDLPTKVVSDKGWWVFDFPFGIARETACALQLDHWEQWLDWCHGEDRPQDYATLRRNTAKAKVEEARLNWAIRRTIDEELGTTWFPMFEQLYRQTIYGAAEVLFPMKYEHSENVEILPWGEPSESKAVVMEGFPGVTIRERLRLPATGYKGRGDDRQDRRKEILAALTGDWNLPLLEKDVALAVEDTEGDAVDALVLLVACRINYDLDRESWQANRDRLHEHSCIVEGWFPS